MFQLYLLTYFHVVWVVYGHIISIQKDQVDISYSVTMYNFCQSDFNRLRFYQDISMSDCVTECGLRKHCKALNYHESMNFCELFTGSGPKVTRKECIHIQRNDINVVKSPCGTACEDGTACNRGTGQCMFTECLEFPEVQNGVILGNSKNVGSHILTKCHRYNQPKDNVKQSYCMSNGQWSPLVECILDCGELTVPSHTILLEPQDNGTDTGNVKMYACEPGFILAEGSLARTCGMDGKWSGEAPQCDAIDCGEPTVPMGLILEQLNGTTYGSEVEYACQPELTHYSGSLTRTCGEDGNWSGEEPLCNCGELIVPSHTVLLEQEDNGTDTGNVKMYACEPGFILAKGSLTRTCGIDGKWSGEAPQCDAIDCGEPTVPMGLILEQLNGTTYGSEVEYACQPELTHYSGSLTRTCGEDGNWSGEEPLCNCGELIVPSHTVLLEQEDNGTDTGNVKMYACEPGFILAKGSLTRTCGIDGKWSGEAPQCDAIDCGEPTVPMGLILEQLNGTTYGSEVEYACQPELTHYSGSLTRTCGEDGNWSGEEPLCSTCTVRGICYLRFVSKDLGGHDDKIYDNIFTFEECSELCESNSHGYKSIEYCDRESTNCYCKTVNDLEGYDLRYAIPVCSYYRKL